MIRTRVLINITNADTPATDNIDEKVDDNNNDDDDDERFL